MDRLTCRAVRFRKQPPDAGAELGPVEVVLVQRFDLRHRGDLVHGAGRVLHGRAAPHGGQGGGSTGENVRRRDGGGRGETEEEEEKGGRRTLGRRLKRDNDKLNENG